MGQSWAQKAGNLNFGVGLGKVLGGSWVDLGGCLGWILADLGWILGGCWVDLWGYLGWILGGSWGDL
jgi:hypothetical protein